MAAGCERIVVDAAHGAMLGGTGQFWPTATSRCPSSRTRCRSCSPAACGPSNVAQAVRDVPADRGRRRIRRRDRRHQAAAQGPAGRRALRQTRQGCPLRPTHQPRLDRSRVPPGLLEADARGRWGTQARLRRPLRARNADVGAARARARPTADVRRDPTFWAELRELSSNFAGRPTPHLSGRSSRRSAGPRCPAVPQARGPGAHRRAQDQQRPWPGPARQTAGQAPA